MKNSKHFISRQRGVTKAAACLLTLALSCQDVVFADPLIKNPVPTRPPAPITDSRTWAEKYLPPFPESVAAVEDAWQAPIVSADSTAPPDALPKTLILIQDAHANTSGQFNVSKTLDLLLSNNARQRSGDRIRYVFLEAGFGDESLSFLRSYADLSTRRRVADADLRKGRLQGTEHLSLASDHSFVLWGVEDLGMYARSIETYRSVIRRRQKCGQLLDRMESAVRLLQSKTANPALLSLDEKRRRYLQEEMSLTEYFTVLAGEAAERSLPLENYPHLRALTRLREMESVIDFEKAAGEQERAVAALTAADRLELEAVSSRRAVRLSGHDPQIQPAYFLLLNEKLGAARAAYPELAKYIAYLEASRRLDPARLLAELNLLERDVFRSLIRNSDEAALFRASRNLEFLKKLLYLTVTPAEYRKYRARKKDFDVIGIAGFLNRKIMDLGSGDERTVFVENGCEETIRACEAFYEQAFRRDKKMVDHLVRKMDAEHQSAAVLVAGGYHSPNLKRLLRRRGVSYICLTPRVLEPTDQRTYEKILFDSADALKKYGIPAGVSAVPSAGTAMPLRTGRDALALELHASPEVWKQLKNRDRNRALRMRTRVSPVETAAARQTMRKRGTGARLAESSRGRTDGMFEKIRLKAADAVLRIYFRFVLRKKIHTVLLQSQFEDPLARAGLRSAAAAGRVIALDLNQIAGATIEEKYRDLMEKNFAAVSEIIQKLITDDQTPDPKPEFFIRELLKNAFIHGSRQDLRLPIYLYLERSEAGGAAPEVHVLNLPVRRPAPEDDRRVIRRLWGFGSRTFTALMTESAAWAYRIRPIAFWGGRWRIGIDAVVRREDKQRGRAATAAREEPDFSQLSLKADAGGSGRLTDTDGKSAGEFYWKTNGGGSQVWSFLIRDQEYVLIQPIEAGSIGIDLITPHSSWIHRGWTALKDSWMRIFMKKRYWKMKEAADARRKEGLYRLVGALARFFASCEVYDQIRYTYPNRRDLPDTVYVPSQEERDQYYDLVSDVWHRLESDRLPEAEKSVAELVRRLKAGRLFVVQKPFREELQGLDELIDEENRGIVRRSLAFKIHAAKSMAQTLRDLHRIGIVHGDFKPSNTQADHHAAAVFGDRDVLVHDFGFSWTTAGTGHPRNFSQLAVWIHAAAGTTAATAEYLPMFFRDGPADVQNARRDIVAYWHSVSELFGVPIGLRALLKKDRDRSEPGRISVDEKGLAVVSQLVRLRRALDPRVYRQLHVMRIPGKEIELDAYWKEVIHAYEDWESDIRRQTAPSAARLAGYTPPSLLISGLTADEKNQRLNQEWKFWLDQVRPQVTAHIQPLPELDSSAHHLVVGFKDAHGRLVKKLEDNQYYVPVTVEIRVSPDKPGTIGFLSSKGLKGFEEPMLLGLAEWLRGRGFKDIEFSVYADEKTGRSYLREIFKKWENEGVLSGYAYTEKIDGDLVLHLNRLNLDQSDYFRDLSPLAKVDPAGRIRSFLKQDPRYIGFAVVEAIHDPAADQRTIDLKPQKNPNLRTADVYTLLLRSLDSERYQVAVVMADSQHTFTIAAAQLRMEEGGTAAVEHQEVAPDSRKQLLMQRAITLLLLHGAIIEWRSGVLLSEEAHRLYARLRDDPRLTVTIVREAGLVRYVVRKAPAAGGARLSADLRDRNTLSKPDRTETDARWTAKLNPALRAALKNYWVRLYLLKMADVNRRLPIQLEKDRTAIFRLKETSEGFRALEGDQTILKMNRQRIRKTRNALDADRSRQKSRRGEEFLIRQTQRLVGAYFSKAPATGSGWVEIDLSQLNRPDMEWDAAVKAAWLESVFNHLEASPDNRYIILHAEMLPIDLNARVEKRIARLVGSSRPGQVLCQRPLHAKVSRIVFVQSGEAVRKTGDETIVALPVRGLPNTRLALLEAELLAGIWSAHSESGGGAVSMIQALERSGWIRLLNAVKRSGERGITAAQFYDIQTQEWIHGNALEVIMLPPILKVVGNMAEAVRLSMQTDWAA